MRSLDARGESPDGRAREPAELLDELRLRLARLPAGHPSADGRETPAGYGGAARDGGGAAREGADGDSRPVAEGDGPEDGGNEAAAAGEVPGDGRADNGGEDGGDETADGDRAGEAGPTAAEKDGAVPRLVSGVADGGGWLGQGPGEPYRPWFVTGEFGVPWFAEDSQAD